MAPLNNPSIYPIQRIHRDGEGKSFPDQDGLVSNVFSVGWGPR